jgi:hypothetical protein
MKLLWFLLRTTDRLVARTLLNALFAALVAAGVTLLVAYEGTRRWPPQQLTDVATVFFAGFAAYAAGITVLLRAATYGLVRAKAELQHGEPAERSPEQAEPPDHSVREDRTA